MRTVAISLLIAAVGVGVASSAYAAPPQKSDKYYVDIQGSVASMHSSFDATLTFSAPVQLPKVQLAPGTYIFTQIGSSVIRVTSEDRKKVYATLNTISATRTHDITRAQVRFERTAAGEPPRLIALYPDGATAGYQLMYSNKHKNVGSVASAATE